MGRVRYRHNVRAFPAVVTFENPIRFQSFEKEYIRVEKTA
jgi:hypothetical protein